MGEIASLDALQEFGYVVIPGVFSSSEVAALRGQLRALADDARARNDFEFDDTYPDLTMLRGDALSMRSLQDFDFVILDKRVVTLVKGVLGPKVVYHGDSSIQIGVGPRGFHKDNVDRNDAGGLDWIGQYQVVRLAIYLQDHAKHSGGLKVRNRSHKFVSHHRGKAVNVDSREGDVVLWYLTTSHSGNALRVKAFPSLCLHPRVENLLPGAITVPADGQRMSLFCTFGAPSQHLDRYIDYQRKRPDVAQHWRRCGAGSHLDRLAKEREVTLLRPSNDFGSHFVSS